jgi:hypothetical protein
MRVTLLALTLLCAGAPLAHAAAAATPHASSAGRAAAAEIGAHELPKNLSVDMKIHADGKDFTMTRSTNENGDSRMDIVTDTGPFTMIQLNDEKKTMYMVSDEKKEVIKQSSAAMMDRMGKHETPAAAPDSAAPEGTIERVGQETVNGVLADKYKVSAQGMDGFLWIDPATGFMQRMQADNGTVDFTNYKVGVVTPERMAPPKNYKLTDMDEMMAKMGGMGGMGGPGGMAKGMMGGMLGGMGSSMGGNMGGAAGGALGGMLGGPLGRMAGQYLGNKLGSKLGGKAASAAASKL